MKSVATITLLIAVSIADGNCPPPVALNFLKCECQAGSLLECRDVASNWHMQLIIKTFKWMRFQDIKFKNLTVDALPSELFSRIQFSRLELIDSAIFRLLEDKQRVSNRSGLNSLTLTRTDIRSGYLDDIGRLRQLSYLKLVGYPHPFGAFSLAKILEGTNLRRLELFSNKFFHWTEQALSPLSVLSVLYFYDMPLNRIRRSDLPANATGIERLTLWQCGLSSLPEDLLEGFTNLRWLDLDDNKLSSLSEDTFRNFNGNLRLNGNPLDCGPGLEWLVHRVRNGSISFPGIVTCKNGTKIMEAFNF